MKKTTRMGGQLLILTALALIILFPKITFDATVSGLSLWAKTILPGLLPAMIVTSCIMAMFPMKAGFAYLYIILCGFFCGFPIGSLLCAHLHKKQHDTLSNQIMAYCNLSSPSFVINYIYTVILKKQIAFPALLLCIYLPALEIIGVLFLLHRRDIFILSKKATETPAVSPSFPDMFDHAIFSSVQNMLKLGGYLVVFSCISAYICMLPVSSPMITAVLCSTTEITNGMYLLHTLSLPLWQLTTLVFAANALGGISTIMQTISITKSSGLNIRTYVCHKLLLMFLTIGHCLVYFFYLQ